MVPRPDGGDGPRAAVAAVAEAQPASLVLGQVRVGRPAHLARHVLHDVLPEERLDVLRDEPSPDDEALVPIDVAFRAELRLEELVHVAGVAVHHPADLLEVYVTVKCIERPMIHDINLPKGFCFVLVSSTVSKACVEQLNGYESFDLERTHPF